jgi:hypothetical protein
MDNQSTIKWRPLWKVWIPIFLFLIPLILEDQLLGTIFTPYIYGLILIAFGILYYFRTKLWQSAVLTIVMAVTIWFYFLSRRPDQTIETFQLIDIYLGQEALTWMKDYITMPVWFIFLALTAITFFTIGPTLSKALDLEGSAIRLFKLSARQVFSEGNGFTDRPYTAGSHSYNRDELIGFATFLEGKKICLAEYPDKGIKLIFSMGISPLCKKYRNRISYVMFKDNGELTVFISEKDYKQYRKQYTFDQLCEMMGKTFLRFAEYYKINKEQRILTELKSV